MDRVHKNAFLAHSTHAALMTKTAGFPSLLDHYPHAITPFNLAFKKDHSSGKHATFSFNVIDTHASFIPHL